VSALRWSFVNPQTCSTARTATAREPFRARVRWKFLVRIFDSEVRNDCLLRGRLHSTSRSGRPSISRRRSSSLSVRIKKRLLRFVLAERSEFPLFRCFHAGRQLPHRLHVALEPRFAPVDTVSRSCVQEARPLVEPRVDVGKGTFRAMPAPLRLQHNQGTRRRSEIAAAARPENAELSLSCRAGLRPLAVQEPRGGSSASVAD